MDSYAAVNTGHFIRIHGSPGRQKGRHFNRAAPVAGPRRQSLFSTNLFN